MGRWVGEQDRSISSIAAIHHQHHHRNITTSTTTRISPPSSAAVRGPPPPPPPSHCSHPRSSSARCVACVPTLSCPCPFGLARASTPSGRSRSPWGVCCGQPSYVRLWLALSLSACKPTTAPCRASLPLSLPSLPSQSQSPSQSHPSHSPPLYPLPLLVSSFRMRPPRLLHSLHALLLRPSSAKPPITHSFAALRMRS